jgi:hypothetical protein
MVACFDGASQPPIYDVPHDGSGIGRHSLKNDTLLKFLPA